MHSSMVFCPSIGKRWEDIYVMLDVLVAVPAAYLASVGMTPRTTNCSTTIVIDSGGGATPAAPAGPGALPHGVVGPMGDYMEMWRKWSAQYAGGAPPGAPSAPAPEANGAQ